MSRQNAWCYLLLFCCGASVAGSIPNSSSEDEVPWRRQRLSPSRPHVCADKCCPLAVSRNDFCAPNIVAVPVLVPRMKEAVRSLFAISYFLTCACDQNIGWPHRDDDFSRGPILDHARRKPAHERASDACAIRGTARREHIKKSVNSDITCCSSPPLELEARQKLNHLWFLRSFWMFAMCSVGSSKEMTGAVESWTRGFRSRL